MNIGRLEEAFKTKSELEVCRLMTCNFDVAAFSLIEPSLPERIATVFKNAMKYRTHLTVNHTSLKDLSNKIIALMERENVVYKGKASKICGYSGVLLEESTTLLGTPDKLVSQNEFSYVIKLYPWWIKSVNPKFEPFVDQYADKVAFFCTQDFDLDSLKDKEDVVSVDEKTLVLKGKIKLPVVRVDL